MSFLVKAAGVNNIVLGFKENSHGEAVQWNLGFYGKS
jgi:hypothetical protein